MTLSLQSLRAQLRGVGSCLLILVACIVTAFSAVIVGAAILTALGINVQEPSISLAFDTLTPALAEGLTVAAYIAISNRYNLINIRRPTLDDWAWMIGGCVLLFALAGAAELVFSALDASTATNAVEHMGSDNPDVFLYLIPVAYLAIGPGEELLFRGAIQGRLTETFSVPASIAIASAFFAVIHVVSLSGTGIEIGLYLLVVFALGLILGYTYEETENIIVPAMIHGTYDAVLFLSMYLQLTGVLAL